MSDEEEKADVVDFDALHAALGDIPPPPTSSTPALAEATSGGKNNAQYSSARPHTIPPTRAPAVDMNAPSIVIADDVPPTSQPNMPAAAAAAQMTIPMGSPILSGVGAVSPGPMPVAVRAPSASHPGFDGPRHPANDAVQQTMHMPGRPIAPPRRPRSPTMVVHARGPSRAKKMLVFFAMLLFVVGVGVAVLAFVRPGGIGIEGFGKKPAPTFSPPTTTPP
ncbi:MAG: hypothetical protein KIT84_27050 [Labilithrix sp.]|nr:hypothetical protein [Labilithrix sp.]MCW5814714.1 hypothetical protein [Labilithrix sp.]